MSGSRYVVFLYFLEHIKCVVFFIITRRGTFGREGKREGEKDTPTFWLKMTPMVDGDWTRTSVEWRTVGGLRGC